MPACISSVVHSIKQPLVSVAMVIGLDLRSLLAVGPNDLMALLTVCIKLFEIKIRQI